MERDKKCPFSQRSPGKRSASGALHTETPRVPGEAKGEAKGAEAIKSPNCLHPFSLAPPPGNSRKAGVKPALRGHSLGKGKRKNMEIGRPLRNQMVWVLRCAVVLCVPISLVACEDILHYREKDSSVIRKNGMIEFDACVLSKSDAEAIVKKFPDKEPDYAKYFANFVFIEKRQCYAQHWIVPATVHGTNTEGQVGREDVHLSFPPRRKGSQQYPGYVEGLEGKGVLVRPIAPNLNFADGSRFRKRGYTQSTGQVFGKYEVWTLTSGNGASIHQALIDKEGKELYASLTLKDGSGAVSEANADWVRVKANLDDIYELSYGLPPRQLNELEEFNEKVKNQVRTYLINSQRN